MPYSNPAPLANKEKFRNPFRKWVNFDPFPKRITIASFMMSGCHRPKIKIISQNYIFIQLKSLQFGAKFGVKFGDKDKRLLLMLNSNPTLAAADLAHRLSISQRGVEKALKRQRELNVLSRKGSTKNGLWEINKS